MITRQELEGSWNSVKGKLQERWGQLTDNDLTQFKGDANQLIGAIQAKTGAAPARHGSGRRSVP